MSDLQAALTCPNCGTALNSNDQFCAGCGLSLNTLTLLLESAETTIGPTEEIPVTPVLRLGEFLVGRGLITEVQLNKALEKQTEYAQRGEPKMLGEVLVEIGAVTSVGMQAAISNQIVTLQNMLRDNNRLLSQRVAERTAELERLLARMKEINQLKVNFLSNVSHELRTPLTQIQGYVYMFDEGMMGDLQPQQTSATREAMMAVDKMRGLIDSLIEYTSAARGELAITSVNFPLADLAQSTLERSSIKAKASQVQLKLEVGEPILARGDVEKLSWVLLQLIDNAIKYTPPDGTVTLRLLPDTTRAKVKVEIQDTGAGIAAERIPQLFEPVRQDGGARGYTGLGLGLMMVRRIVAAHDSELKVESRVGAGSTFSFELPLAG